MLAGKCIFNHASVSFNAADHSPSWSKCLLFRNRNLNVTLPISHPTLPLPESTLSAITTWHCNRRTGSNQHIIKRNQPHIHELSPPTPASSIAPSPKSLNSCILAITQMAKGARSLHPHLTVPLPPSLPPRPSPPPPGGRPPFPLVILARVLFVLPPSTRLDRCADPAGRNRAPPPLVTTAVSG